MKKQRQLHLWIGLITSVFIFIEAVTGLLLSEPWLMGVDRPGGLKGEMDREPTLLQEENTNPFPVANQGEFAPERDGGDFNLIRIVKGLHEGRIGSANARILVDITAIGLIILSVTGISLSIQVLKAQSMRRKKELEGSQNQTAI